VTDARKIALGIILAALAAGTWWLTHRTGVPTGTLGPQVRHEPDYTIDDFIGNVMDAHGARKYRLTAQRLTHYPDDDTTHLTRPVLVQYLPDGVTATTRADAGVMPGDGSEIIMTGDVRVTRTANANAGGEVTADHLRIQLDR
jgi:lipopolysaccharide export system protein LptC